MKKRFGIKANVVVATCVVIGLFVCLGVSSLAFQKEKKPLMTTHASGTFDVKVTPQGTDEKDAVVGRFSLDKQFHGDLSGTSKGVMLAVSTAVSGSAGYVAMEQVTGTLNGRTGTFALQHTGTMTRGALSSLLPSCRTLEPASSPVSRERWISRSPLENISTSLTTPSRRRLERGCSFKHNPPIK